MGEIEKEEVSVLLSVGSNLGDRRANIERALELLEAEPAVRLVRVAALIETEPVGGPPQGPYLNGAIEIRTSLEPRALLMLLQRLEAGLGRVRTIPNAPRPLDLDILVYGEVVLDEPGLVIPHPRMLERAFVLEPLAAIAAERLHPLTGRSFADHWRSLRREVKPCG